MAVDEIKCCSKKMLPLKAYCESFKVISPYGSVLHLVITSIYNAHFTFLSTQALYFLNIVINNHWVFNKGGYWGGWHSTQYEQISSTLLHRTHLYPV